MSAPKDYRQDRESFRLDFVASAVIWIGLACLAAWGQHKSMTAKHTVAAVATPVACSTPAAPVAPAAPAPKTPLRQAGLH